MVFAHCSKTWLDLPHPPENLENGPNVGDMQHLTLARTGGLVQSPPLRFLTDSEKNGGATRRRVLGYLMGQTLRNIWQHKIWSGQVRSRSYDVIRGTTSGNFSNKVVFSRNLTWQMTWQIDANDNIWTWLGQDVARLEFAHRQWPRLTWHLPQITNFVLRTVSLGGGFVLHGSFRIYVTMTDIAIIFECQVADSWRHKFDLWRHRGDTVSFMSTIHTKYSTEMHQNTTFYA